MDWLTSSTDHEYALLHRSLNLIDPVWQRIEDELFVDHSVEIVHVVLKRGIVITGACDQCVVAAVATSHVVVARVADETVDTRFPIQRIIVVAAITNVVTVSTIDPIISVVAAECIVSGVIVQRVRRRPTIPCPALCRRRCLHSKRPGRPNS